MCVDAFNSSFGCRLSLTTSNVPSRCRKRKARTWPWQGRRSKMLLKVGRSRTLWSWNLDKRRTDQQFFCVSAPVSVEHESEVKVVRHVGPWRAEDRSVLSSPFDGRRSSRILGDLDFMAVRRSKVTERVWGSVTNYRLTRGPDGQSKALFRKRQHLYSTDSFSEQYLDTYSCIVFYLKCVVFLQVVQIFSDLCSFL